MNHANAVGHGVVETECQDETTALQTRHLNKKNGGTSDSF